ncbi:MAG: nucleotidyltransferase family protein, partial [Bacteroidia bacterium]|nr:nucleotidyltransferase family protein [Bacteroidia bacterium]
GEVQDWNKMVKLINAHGIIALAAYNIREAGLEKLLPEDAMATLDNGRMQSMIRNTWLTERWKEVNTILTNAGIKYVLLKGMALEHTLYGAKGLRQMNDNDILVKREDALKAWFLLQKEGFAHGLIKSSLHKRILCDIGKHLPCLYKDGYAIEIHHKLYDINLIDEKNLYDPVEEAVEILIGGNKAWTLSEKHQLAHLTDHFKKHATGGEIPLRIYADIVLLDKNIKIEIPDDFILNPQQNYKVKYLKAGYKAGVNSIHKKYRLRYVFGDIFPSVKWMKNRYKCGTFKAILHYPPRVGKVLWVIGGKA